MLKHSEMCALRCDAMRWEGKIKLDNINVHCQYGVYNELIALTIVNFLALRCPNKIFGSNEKKNVPKRLMLMGFHIR